MCGIEVVSYHAKNWAIGTNLVLDVWGIDSGENLLEVLGEFVVIVDPDVRLISHVPVHSRDKHLTKGLSIIDTNRNIWILIVALTFGRLGQLHHFDKILQLRVSKEEQVKVRRILMLLEESMSWGFTGVIVSLAHIQVRWCDVRGPSSSSGVLKTPFGCLFSSIATESCLVSCLVCAHAIRESRDPPPSTLGDVDLMLWSHVLHHHSHYHHTPDPAHPPVFLEYYIQLCGIAGAIFGKEWWYWPIINDHFIIKIWRVHVSNTHRCGLSRFDQGNWEFHWQFRMCWGGSFWQNPGWIAATIVECSGYWAEIAKAIKDFGFIKGEHMAMKMTRDSNTFFGHHWDMSLSPGIWDQFKWLVQSYYCCSPALQEHCG